MREHIYRGKRIDNGEWEYGFILKQSYGDKKTFIFTGYHIETKDKENCYEFTEVIPETVGQFTSLILDKTRVFEGDIILCKSRGLKYKYLVMWEEAGFYIRIITDDGLSPGSWRLWEILAYPVRKVIGNKYDNPELLEAK